MTLDQLLDSEEFQNEMESLDHVILAKENYSESLADTGRYPEN